MIGGGEIIEPSDEKDLMIGGGEINQTTIKMEECWNERKSNF